MRLPEQQWPENPEYGVISGAALPAARITEIRNNLTREISDFTVSFIVDKHLSGTGTLITSDGAYGILTASHVADVLDGKDFGLNIAEFRHQFVLPKFCVERIAVCNSRAEHYGDSGPDLAIIKILDPIHRGTIEGRKLFTDWTEKILRNT